MYVHRMTDVLFHMLSNIVCLRGLADLRQSDKLILKKINQVSCCATDLVGLMFGDKRKWQEKIIVGVKMSFKVIDFPGSHDKCGQGTIIKTLIVDYLFKKPKTKENSNCSLLYQHLMFCGGVHPPQSFCINWFLYPPTSSFAPLIYCCSQGWVFLLKCCLWFI